MVEKERAKKLERRKKYVLCFIAVSALEKK
jgi:hypothetical protein